MPDVEQFSGHIACDGDSKSEIVVPIINNGKVSLLIYLPSLQRLLICLRLQTMAIIDIDCADLHGFDEEDQKYLEELSGILAEACEW